MATAQKKNAGGKRTASGTGRTASGSRAAGSRKKAPAPRPIRREVGAVACLLLAIFSAFGYFHIQAIFIDFFCGLVKGLIGYGYWLLPPMLLVASGILVFHRGRPVRLRVWCALLTPVLVGCLLHLILTRGSYEWSLELVKTLWSQGEALKSGGVVSGSIALGLTAVFSKYGAGVIFVLIAAMNVVLNRFTGSLGRCLEQGSHIHIEATVSITGCYDFSTTVVTVLSHLCNHDTRLTPLFLRELLGQFTSTFEVAIVFTSCF